MGKVNKIVVWTAGFILASTLGFSEVSMVAVEDFNSYTAGDWFPTKSKEGWSCIFEGEAYTALDNAYGRSGLGMALFRPPKSWNAMYWYPKGGLNDEINTVQVWVKVSERGFCDITTWREDGKGVARVTLKPGEGIIRCQDGVDVLMGANDFQSETWYKIEIIHDFGAGKYKVRINDKEWKHLGGPWGYFMEKRGASSAPRISFTTTLTSENTYGCCIDDLATYHLEIEKGKK